MCQTNDNNLFYTCSLVEYLGRLTCNHRDEVVRQLGQEQIKRLYAYADVFHCEPIEKVATEFAEEVGLTHGNFDNVADCIYEVPSYWDIGKIYARLIEDICGEREVIDVLWEVFNSFIVHPISDFNTAVYYQSREYILACYHAGEVL